MQTDKKHTGNILEFTSSPQVTYDLEQKRVDVETPDRMTMC